MAKNRVTRTRWNVLSIGLLICLIAYCICLLSPLVLAFLNSFKDLRADYLAGNKTGLPRKWLFSNYADVFKYMIVEVTGDNGKPVGVDILGMYGYSLMYAGGCAFTATLAPCLMAYCCAKFPCKFSKIIYTTVIVCMVLPIVGNLPSEIRIAQSVGVYNQIWGLWIMKFGFLGIYFLVFYATFEGIPMTYTEAAKIDGAGNWRIFLQIIMPLVKNTFFTIMLIKFTEFWNDYQTPFIYLEDYPTIALGLQMAFDNSLARRADNPMTANTTLCMAATMLVLLPILTVFLIFQKRFLGDLMIGGVKG